MTIIISIVAGIIGFAVGLFICLFMNAVGQKNKASDYYTEGYIDGYKANRELYHLKGSKE